MAEQVKTRRGSERATATKGSDLSSPSLFFNRELSLLQFQRRVLAQATDRRHPPLERMKFIAIVSSNLDEFFMVRVSDLLDLIQAGVAELGPDGMTPAQQLSAVRAEVTELLREQRRILRDELLPELAD